MNKTTLIGRVTKDVELRYTQNQKPFVRFTLAVQRYGQDDHADFISCQAWGRTAENMEKYIHQGDEIGIVGHIQTGKYDKDGHTVYTTEVVVESMEFLRKKNGQQAKEPDPVPESDDFLPIPEDIDEELPF